MSSLALSSCSARMDSVPEVASQHRAFSFHATPDTCVLGQGGGVKVGKGVGKEGVLFFKKWC